MTRPRKPCGTWAAYQRHLQNREVPCQACETWRETRTQAQEDKLLAPYRRAVLAAALYSGRRRRGVQRARQAARLRGDL